MPARNERSHKESLPSYSNTSRIQPNFLIAHHLLLLPMKFQEWQEAFKQQSMTQRHKMATQHDNALKILPVLPPPCIIESKESMIPIQRSLEFRPSCPTLHTIESEFDP